MREFTRDTNTTLSKRILISTSIRGFFLVLILLATPVGLIAAENLEFQCPRAYQGIKSDMLPTYWETMDQGKYVGAGQSHVQGRYMICIYRKSAGEKIGNVRRLIPKGYRCITGGKGAFQCHRKR